MEPVFARDQVLEAGLRGGRAPAGRDRRRRLLAPRRHGGPRRRQLHATALKPGHVFSIDPQLRVPEENLYIRYEDTVVGDRDRRRELHGLPAVGAATTSRRWCGRRASCRSCPRRPARSSSDWRASGASRPCPGARLLGTIRGFRVLERGRHAMNQAVSPRDFIRILVGTALGLGALTTAQAQEAPKPGPEHKRLGYYVGNWTVRGGDQAQPLHASRQIQRQDLCLVPGWFRSRVQLGGQRADGADQEDRHHGLQHRGEGVHLRWGRQRPHGR